MQLGVSIPVSDIGTSPTAVRDYAQAAEGLGYSHLLVGDHVLGANPAAEKGVFASSGAEMALHNVNFRRVGSSMYAFHDPFVLFGYLASFTQRLELVTGVIILGQRQTALVAKQAAEVDVLTGGRLRLGVGIGWNQVE